MRKTIYAALLVLLGVSVQAGEATFDFSSDPTATLNIGGNNPQPWVENGGNPGGFMAITWPTGSQTTGMVFPDIDDGGIITAFKFEADLRVGNSTGDRAADGFSISIARENDPLFEDPGNQGLFAGGIMEGGSTTGIAISFDTWSGNTYSDGGDIEGILVRVDDKTVLRHAVPTRHGACDDATSLQTGPRDAQYWADGGDFLEPASWEGLCWQPLVVELNDSAQLTVIWKGTTILDNFQTDFFPSAGRLVLAGRTGGANEHTHIDNIKLTTSASGDDTTPPTNPANVAGSAGARFASITWDAATDDSGRVGYEVEIDGGAPVLLSGAEFTDTGLNPGTSYTYRVRAIDISGNSSDWQSVSVTTGAEQEVVGFLLGEIYDNIPGVDVETVLFSDGYFDGVVSRGVYLNGLSFNVNPGGDFGSDYGIVIKGVLTAPETGQFDFFVRSDDASQFFLNESGAAAPDPILDLWIAEETGCCNTFQEVGAIQTTQVPISLTAGREYGFTFVVSEGGGGDWGEVAMRKVGDPTPAIELTPIRGELLKGMGDPTGADLSITAQPANTTGEEGSFATITVEADVTSPYDVGAYYQWSKDEALISGATRETLVLRDLSSADEGSYSVKVGTMGKIVTSSAATLTVVPPGQLPSGGGSGSVDVRVTSGLDDAEEHLTEGNSIDLTSSDLELGAEGGGGDAQVQGIRFRDILIPSGATITSATIQFTVDEADDEPTSVLIYGELSPDAAAYTDATGDITARPRTTAVVEWNDIPNWDTAGTAGPDQLTPDLSSIVQEIIEQEGWNGNAMAFIIEGTENSERTAESFDGDQGAAALLHIDYTSGDGGGDTLTVQIDFGGTEGNGAGASPEPWVTIDSLTQDQVVELGGGITLTALDDGYTPNNAGAPGDFVVYDTFLIPQEARGDYLYKTVDTAGTDARLKIDGLPEGTYNITVFEGRTTDASQFAKIWTGAEPADENTGTFAGGSASVEVVVSAGETLWYKHLEDNSGGISGMIIRQLGAGDGGGGGDGSAISIARSAGGVTITFDGTLQSSNSVTGPYTDVAGATSPADIPLSGSAQFFRAQQ